MLGLLWLNFDFLIMFFILFLKILAFWYSSYVNLIWWYVHIKMVGIGPNKTYNTFSVKCCVWWNIKENKNKERNKRKNHFLNLIHCNICMSKNNQCSCLICVFIKNRISLVKNHLSTFPLTNWKRMFYQK